MVLGLGKAGLLPERRSKAGTSTGRALGASSSSPPTSLAGATESGPRTQQASPVAQPGPARLGQFQQQQAARPQFQAQQEQPAQQHATHSVGSFAPGPSAAAGVEAAAAEPQSVDAEDHPAGLASGAAATSPTSATCDRPSELQEPAPGGRVGHQAASRRKPRAVERLTQAVGQPAQSLPLGAGLGTSHEAPWEPAEAGAQGTQPPPPQPQQQQEEQQWAEAPAAAAAAQPGPAEPEQGARAAAPPESNQEVASAPEALPPQGEEPAARRQQQQQQQAAAPPDVAPKRRGKHGRAVDDSGEGGVATPVAKRGKKKKPGARLTPSKYADLLGKTVEVPASLFSVDVPDLYYRGVVTKREGGRKQEAMELKFLDDGSKYWFPTTDIRRWLEDMEARGATKDAAPRGIASGKATDEFAAEVLTDMASSLKSGPKSSQLSDASARPRGRKRGAAAARAPAAVASRGQAVGGAAARAAGGGGGRGGAAEEGAVSSKRRKQATPMSLRMADSGGVELRTRNSSGLAALHVMADAAGMNLLSSPRESPEGGT